MTNDEIYREFRSQDKYLKFSDFIENCIEWLEEIEPYTMSEEMRVNLEGMF
jgi:hypothetical protein